MDPILAFCLISCFISVTAEAPTFDGGIETFGIEENSYCEVYCTARGDRPIDYRWYDPEENEIPSGPLNSTFSFRMGNGSYLVIPKADVSHAGIYTCKANNSHGLSSKLFRITVVTSEKNETDNGTSAITSIKIISVTNNSVVFDIRTVGRARRINVRYHDVYRDRNNFTTFWNVGQRYEVGNLNASWKYAFSFKLDESDEYSKMHEAVLLPATPEIIFRGLKDGTLTIEFFRKFEDILRGTIDRYVLSYNSVQQVGGNSWESRNCTINVEIPSCFLPRYTVTGLSQSSYYEIRVRAHTESGFGTAYHQKVYIA